MTLADWLAARWYAARYAKRKSAEDALMGEWMAPETTAEVERLVKEMQRKWQAKQSRP